MPLARTWGSHLFTLCLHTHGALTIILSEIFHFSVGCSVGREYNNLSIVLILFYTIQTFQLAFGKAQKQSNSDWYYLYKNE